MSLLAPFHRQAVPTRRGRIFEGKIDPRLQSVGVFETDVVFAVSPDFEATFGYSGEHRRVVRDRSAIDISLEYALERSGGIRVHEACPIIWGWLHGDIRGRARQAPVTADNARRAWLASR